MPQHDDEHGEYDDADILQHYIEFEAVSNQGYSNEEVTANEK